VLCELVVVSRGFEPTLLRALRGPSRCWTLIQSSEVVRPGYHFQRSRAACLPRGYDSVPDSECGGIGDLVDTEAQGAEHGAVVSVETVEQGRWVVAVEGHEAALVAVGEGVLGGGSEGGCDASDCDHFRIVQIDEARYAASKRAR
jgi:hypothetical protein